uniref:Bet v I/Major latex protein domain-containing protein n=1 Tax=Leersia perrieri TaxID=77586 RepID=A0A0D9W8U6_9ORYZ
MKGSICHELETELPAAEVWDIYGGLRVGQLVPQLVPEFFPKVELVEGDGGVGTVQHVIFTPGTPGGESMSMRDKIIKIDNENYIREGEVIEGGFLDHGFQKYVVRIEIIQKTDTSSIIRSTIEFEAEEASAASSVSTSGLAAVAEAVTKYMKEQRIAEQQAPEPTSDE